ncbi:hypothetical protein V8C44DRAFT_326972 [Trichoderma aethiopicum]
MDGTRFDSMSERRTPSGPTRSWPQTSSRVLGRMRSARGAARWVFVFLILRPSSSAPWPLIPAAAAAADAASSMGRSSMCLSSPPVRLVSCRGVSPGPSSKARFLPASGGNVVLVNGVWDLNSVTCRFGAGVEKKLEALRFWDCGWECGGAVVVVALWEGIWGAGVGGVGVEKVSDIKVVQPESRWSLMSVDLTGLLQMGQATAMAGGLVYQVVVDIWVYTCRSKRTFQEWSCAWVYRVC